MSIKEGMFAGTLATVGILIFVWILPISLDKQAKMDCYKWQSYEREYPLFELSKGDADYCESVGITIK